MFGHRLYTDLSMARPDVRKRTPRRPPCHWGRLREFPWFLPFLTQSCKGAETRKGKEEGAVPDFACLCVSAPLRRDCRVTYPDVRKSATHGSGAVDALHQVRHAHSVGLGVSPSLNRLSRDRMIAATLPLFCLTR